MQICRLMFGIRRKKQTTTKHTRHWEADRAAWTCLKPHLTELIKLTVGRHSHHNALLEATFLALVPGHFVDDTFPLVLAGIGRVEILLDRPPEETLEKQKVRCSGRFSNGDECTKLRLRFTETRSRYLTTFTGDAAIVVACGFVPAHYT